MTTNNKTPEERAAQIWCEPAHGKKVMDADFAMSIARAIREAVDEERERCAGIAINADIPYARDTRTNDQRTGWAMACGAIATAIRATKEDGK